MRVWEIVRVIEESPVKAISGDGINVVFQTPDGHAYDVFMDCGEPDYLHWIQIPGGDRVEFWRKDEDEATRATTALGYLAGNLLHLPHVSDRLKKAAQQAGIVL